MNLWKKSYCETTEMKAAEQYIPLVLFIMLYKVVDFGDEIQCTEM